MLEIFYKPQNLKPLLLYFQRIPYTVGRINFEDKKFRGFRGYLLNLEIKYPRKFPA